MRASARKIAFLKRGLRISEVWGTSPEKLQVRLQSTQEEEEEEEEEAEEKAFEEEEEEGRCEKGNNDRPRMQSQNMNIRTSHFSGILHSCCFLMPLNPPVAHKIYEETKNKESR